MKNLIPTISFFCCLLLFVSQKSFGDESAILTNKKVPEKLLAKYDSEIAKQHPEHGILPFNAPCTDCIELLEKRTPNSREFVKDFPGKGYKETYIQKSLGDINYPDKNGFLVTADPRLVQENGNVFAARHQPSPIVIDLENKFASITNSTGELRFNKNICLVLVNKKGETKNFGVGDWSHVVRSENYTETTILIQEFYPGIDLQMTTAAGRVKTSFILKNKLQFEKDFADGWLTFSQQIEIPNGLMADLSASESVEGNKRLGTLNISDKYNQRFFNFTKSYVFDGREVTDNYLEMPFTLKGNKLDYYVPMTWLNNPSTVYPVSVDPFVNSSDSLLKAAIIGSGFTQAPACDTGGCNYFLTVNTPPNCEVTDINCYFSYLANLPCIRDDGGFSITMTNPNGDSCTSRHFTCLGGIQGACFFWPAALYSAVPPLSPCLLPPQCLPYPLTFRMQFRRCHNIPIVPCDASCILANSNWIMNIVGRTVELTNVTLPQTICEGQCCNIAATGDWGVPLVVGTNNYTFTWMPGGLVGDVVNVCPTTTTHYDVTLTDLCGITDNGSTDVTVVPFQNPGFTIAPNDTVCTTQPMTFTGGGAAAASSYDWIISCPGNSSFNDQQVLNYNAPGTATNCSATLTFQVTVGALTCNFSQTQPFVVQPGTSPTANITYVPNGTLCPGQAATFTANVTNGGVAPTFQWFVNGAPSGGNVDSLNLNAPAANFTVSVHVTSNSPCATPDTAYAFVVVPVSNAVVPSVTIAAVPGTICPGQAVTFTATATNGGSAPTYQWQLNSVPIAGATDSTYVTNPVSGTDVYTVIMTSNSPCVAPPTAQANSSVVITANIVPTVTLAADTTVCEGTQVTFTAATTNEGAAPTYQWQLNGTNIAGATNATYTTTPAVGSGTYSMILTSSLACANPNTATDDRVITVLPTVVPSISIVASVNNVCPGDPVQFTATPVGGGTVPNYQWTFNGALAGGNSTTFDTLAAATSFTVTVQLLSNAACASPATASDNINITVLPVPVPGIAITMSDDTVCAGTPVNFLSNSVNPGTAPTYQWFLNGNPIGGANATSYTTTPASGDQYSVVMTSNAQCVSPPTAGDTAEVIVLSNSGPTVVITSDQPQVVCDGTPMTFTATAANAGTPSYQWLLNGTAIAGETNSTYSPASVLTGDIFECIVTTSLPCAIPTGNDTLQMTILPIIPTSVSLVSTDDTICSGTPVTFTATPTGGGTDPVYEWAIAGSAVAGNDTSFMTSSTLNNGDVITVTMTSDLPCSAPAVTDFTIFVTPTPIPSVSQISFPSSVCQGDTLFFQAAGLNPGTTPVWQWFVNGVPEGNNSASYWGILNNGDVVTVDMTSNAPCVNPPTASSNPITASVTAFVTPDITISSTAATDTICLGQNVTFNAVGNNGGTAPVYEWYINGVLQPVTGVTFSSSSLQQGDLISAVLTSNEICLTQPTANSNIIAISVYPPLNLIAAGTTTICPFEPVTLTSFPGGGNGGPYGFNWSHDAGTTASVIVAPGVTTEYEVTVTDNCGSTPVSDSVLVTVNPSPEADLKYKPIDPSTLAPDVTFTDLSINNPITWQWTFGDGDSSSVENPAHTYQQPGDYEVTLVVTNIYGCIDSVTYRVIVKEDISVFIPNTFTPNGDGKNEFFTPMGSSLEDFDFWIFDRWGKEIFHGNEVSPWLGFTNGKPAPEDVYVYKVDLKYSKFGKRYVTGRVSLVY